MTNYERLRDKLQLALLKLSDEQLLALERFIEAGGITRREYFAAKALNGMCSTEAWPTPEDGPELAKRAYAIADAMLHVASVD